MYFFASGGDYPFLNRREISNLPPLKSPERQEIENLVNRRGQIAGRRPDHFERILHKRLANLGVPHLLRDAIVGLLHIGQPRPSASEALMYMNFFFNGGDPSSDQELDYS